MRVSNLTGLQFNEIIAPASISVAFVKAFAGIFTLSRIRSVSGGSGSQGFCLKRGPIVLNGREERSSAEMEVAVSGIECKWITTEQGTCVA